MMKKMTAALLALMMTASLCACGTDDPAAEETGSKAASSEAETTAPAETAAPEETTAPAAGELSAEESESESAEPVAYGEKPAAGDELATVQYLADTYFKALENKDYETLIEVTDVDLMSYITTGEMPDHETQLAFAEELCSSAMHGAGVEISKPEKESEYAKQYNDFFKMMDEKSEGELTIAEKFKVEDAYAVRLKTSSAGDIATSSDDTDGISIDVSGSFDINMDIDMPIIKVNGEWKCDPQLSVLMSFYNAFSDMADDMSDAGFEVSVSK